MDGPSWRSEFALYVYPFYILEHKPTKTRVKLTELRGEVLSILMGSNGRPIDRKDIEKALYSDVVGPYNIRNTINNAMWKINRDLLEFGIRIKVESKSGVRYRIFQGLEKCEPEIPPVREVKKRGPSYFRDATLVRRKVSVRGSDAAPASEAHQKEAIRLERLKKRWQERDEEKRKARKALLKTKTLPKSFYVRKKGAKNPPSPPTRLDTEASWTFPDRHPNAEARAWNWNPDED